MRPSLTTTHETTTTEHRRRASFDAWWDVVIKSSSSSLWRRALSFGRVRVRGNASEIKSATTTTIGAVRPSANPRGTQNIQMFPCWGHEFDVDVIDDERKSLPAAFGKRSMVRLDDDDDDSDDRGGTLPDDATTTTTKMVATMRTKTSTYRPRGLFQTLGEERNDSLRRRR